MAKVMMGKHPDSVEYRQLDVVLSPSCYLAKISVNFDSQRSKISDSVDVVATVLDCGDKDL